MTHMTRLDELKRHITLLASVEETDAPFVSAYLNLENGPGGWHRTLDERACVLRRVLKNCAVTTSPSRARQPHWTPCAGEKWTHW